MHCLMRLNQMTALSLCTVGVLLFLLMPASAGLQQISEANVTEVRAYAGGNAHITISVNTACSGTGRRDILRVSGPGTNLVYGTALAALLADKTVEVEYDDVRSGNYCTLSYLRIK
jgi:hypothetical protein